MGIHAQNSLNSHFFCQFPEAVHWIVSLIRKSQYIDFCRLILLLQCFTNRQHILAVCLIVTQKMRKIRMSQIQVIPRLNPLDRQTGVLCQVSLLFERMSHIYLLFVRSQKMLSLDHIVQRITGKKFFLLLDQCRQILRLKPYIDPYIFFILFFQSLQRGKIPIYLRRCQPDPRHITIRIHKRTVICESQHLKSSLNGTFYIFSIFSRCMTAPLCMGMIIYFHNLSFFLSLPLIILQKF